MKQVALIASLALLTNLAAVQPSRGDVSMKKVKDIIIYQDKMYYSAFPSLVVRPDGEILCAFRRAPDRHALWGAKGRTHTDPNSYLVLVRSKDGGETWTREPELIHAHPLGGSQDPCMVQLKDGTIVCTSYAWAQLPPEAAEEAVKNSLTHRPFAFLGGYLMRSLDAGKSWQGPITPPSLLRDRSTDALGQPCPTFNRGAILEGKDGRLYWAVVRHDQLSPRLSSVHLLTSSDKGKTWEYACPIAEDPKVSFNETSLVQTQNGDIIAFMRTADFDGKLAYARSTDLGKSFEKWQDGRFFGHPFHALRLGNGRVFLIYGYRAEPFGIRARLLKPDCSDITDAPEMVLRDDGGNVDIGYPWAVMLEDGKILAAYYFNQKDGTRYIAGSIISLN